MITIKSSRKVQLILFAVFGFLAVVFFGCKTENLEDILWEKQGCDTTKVSFELDLLPVFDIYCNDNVCHGGMFPQGRINLTSYEGVRQIAEEGRLIPAINREGPQPMPPDEPLPDCEVMKIKAWINQGLQNN